ncbi:MAG: hypothetical protein DCC69_15250 [Hyphomicrobiales bacterium]|nr:MAG: hypothetical protein DCC69_15250 [Hyphomicrobiales bacterium]
MSSIHQQHLTPANMTMIETALARVRLLYNLKPGSDEELHVAAVMVGEFQIGNATETGLYNVFLGPTDTATHFRRKQQMRLALQQWEDEGGAVHS